MQSTNWISQAIDILFEQTDFFPIVENKAWLFFGLSKTVISLFCSQNYWKLISNTALYGAQIYKPFLNAINGAIERTQNEKKRNIWHIWSFPVLIFPKKSRWDTHPASPHPFKKVPETFLSSFLYHPEMVFCFSLKQWAKVLSAVTICDFRTITSKVSTNMWVSDSVLSKSTKKCVSTVITKWVGKNWRFTTAYTVLLRILKVSLTLLAVWGNDLNKILALDNELGGLFC